MKKNIKHNDYEQKYYKAISDTISVNICTGSDIEKQKTFSLPANYQPNESEIYMNDMQLKYFKIRLSEWKQTLTCEIFNGEQALSDQTMICSDSMDLASIERDRTSILLTHERRLQCLRQIDLALQRIQQGEYGYCLETGDDIGIKRLLLNPVALYTVEVQEELELRSLQSSSSEN